MNWIGIKEKVNSQKKRYIQDDKIEMTTGKIEVNPKIKPI